MKKKEIKAGGLHFNIRSGEAKTLTKDDVKKLLPCLKRLAAYDKAND